MVGVLFKWGARWFGHPRAKMEPPPPFFFFFFFCLHFTLMAFSKFLLKKVMCHSFHSKRHKKYTDGIFCHSMIHWGVDCHFFNIGR
jgi:hypothetical protein